MKSLACSLYGHDLKVTKKITSHIKEYQCQKCKKKYTTSPSGSITELTQKRQEINTVLENMHQKKLNRKVAKVYS
ncbi:MAG: hypothetical protein ED556_07150 [Winogradskyella sp.]|uniref:hypothetical protein n=1 Tax=Winogradskyella sp. TaxID=1883156 RepID=UPI000F3AC96A|nr:hypothetical protein [Winogradskyella sp.]RNC87190.1 MAG: hypothetical protein ED556_07150 [Winogradskyella sp.]